MRKNTQMCERLKDHQHKITTVQTALKFNKSDFISKDELKHVKERINDAFSTLIQMHNQTIERDVAIVESLLETQQGKLRRLIVKRATHEELK